MFLKDNFAEIVKDTQSLNKLFDQKAYDLVFIKKYDGDVREKVLLDLVRSNIKNTLFSLLDPGMFDEIPSILRSNGALQLAGGVDTSLQKQRDNVMFLATAQGELKYFPEIKMGVYYTFYDGKLYDEDDSIPYKCVVDFRDVDGNLIDIFSTGNTTLDGFFSGLKKLYDVFDSFRYVD